jgi:tetratricopeptide (TPR) repeat protein
VRYVAAHLANVDGQADVASVIFEPLVKKQAEATPASLAQQAVFVDGDPIYPRTVARDLARDLREQAVEDDPALWGPRLWLSLERGDKAQPADLARDLEKVVADFPEVPTVVAQLARVYGQLGWQPERLRTLEKAAEQFSEDVDVLLALLEAYEQSGQPQAADRLAARIRAIDPTQEVAFRRALSRKDYDAAIAELRRLARIRRDREEIALRIADLLVRAGRSEESIETLRRALARDPDDPKARLALADARFAAGDDDALTDALVSAIQTGAEEAPLRNAIELVEGATDLEPFRRDGLAAIRAAEKSGVELPGTAVRILDYGALWVSRDGRARMLEHEIIRVQSREGIARHAEQSPRGVILHLRTIKADGTILEPEIVAGKPTVTMPKLEVGDYIETEHILTLPGASRDGRRYRSPRWFFREENTSYLESEFVIISPAGRDLVVETTGAVPEAEVVEQPGLTVHRWRVTGSVALPEEPLSAPINEFLPSVRAGWGIDLESQLRRVVELSLDDTPADPRMVRIAKTIVAGELERSKGRAKLSKDEQARRIYRWVLDTIQPGKEGVGPRIITGKSGDRMRAFTYLAGLAGLDARLGLIRDRLAPPPRGPFSEAEMFQVPAVRLGLEEGSRWFVVGERFAPYGYLPSNLRGQPAAVIQPEGRITSVVPPLPARETTSDTGGDTGIAHVADLTLRADGSASLALEQTYRGRYAIQLRTVLNKVPVARRNDVVEAQLLGLALPGGRLEELEVPNLEALDEPVTLDMKVDAPNFARVAEGELVIEVPFLGSIAKLVRLPERETPLYISARLATRAEVELRIKLPKGAEPVELAEPMTIDEPQLFILAEDAMKDGVLVIRRRVRVPAGRVQPKDYAAFKARVIEGDAALNRKVRIRL